MNRRQALGRLALAAAGTLAACALPETTGAAVEAPEPDADAHHGPIRVHLSDEPGYDAKMGTTLAALFLRLNDGHPDPVPLWVNDELVAAARRPAVERWARRQLGAGDCFGVVFTGDPEWSEFVA